MLVAEQHPHARGHGGAEQRPHARGHGGAEQLVRDNLGAATALCSPHGRPTLHALAAGVYWSYWVYRASRTNNTSNDS